MVVRGPRVKGPQSANSGPLWVPKKPSPPPIENLTDAYDQTDLWMHEKILLSNKKEIFLSPLQIKTTSVNQQNSNVKTNNEIKSSELVKAYDD